MKSALDKALLKKKRLSEDLLKAENSDKYRLYGELLTANIHLIQAGARSVEVVNYYDGSNITIPLSEKLSGAKMHSNTSRSIRRLEQPSRRRRFSLKRLRLT